MSLDKMSSDNKRLDINKVRLFELKLKSSCKLCVVVNYISLTALFLWSFIRFCGEYTDTIIYILEILVAFLFLNALKRYHLEGLAKCQKFICIIETVLFLIYINLVELTPFVKNVIIIMYVSKYFLKYQLWRDLLVKIRDYSFSKADKELIDEIESCEIVWRGINLFVIIAVAIFIFCNNLAFGFVTFFMLLMRLLAQLRIIKDCNGYFENLESESGSFKLSV